MEQYLETFNPSGNESQAVVIEAWLKKFRLACYQVKLKALESIQLPNYAGSTLRGAFGWAFRRVSCTRVKEDCKNCLLRKACAYALFFETQGDHYVGNLRPLHAPRPFIIELPLQGQQTFSPGEYLTFGITLVGKANDYLPYFILAFDEMGQTGLGKGRGRFVLDSVRKIKPAVTIDVYDSAIGRIEIPTTSDGLTAVLETSYAWEKRENLEIDFITPGRFIQGGKLVDNLTFEVLIRALLRRVTWLGRFHCDIDIDLDYNNLIENARKVQLLNNEMTWYDWERFSQRQNSKIKLGGLVGKVVYNIGWEKFWWLLALGELLHVGKGATFGLGRYSVLLSKFTTKYCFVAL